MGGASVKPTLPQGNMSQRYYVEIPEVKLIETNRQITSKQDQPHELQHQIGNKYISKNHYDQKVLQQSGDKAYWPQNHQVTIKLPEVKPPAKKLVIKKTRQIMQAKQNQNKQTELQELCNVETVKSEFISGQSLNSRGKTAPLICSKQHSILQFGKTKKCRVSRML